MQQFKTTKTGLSDSGGAGRVALYGAERGKAAAARIEASMAARRGAARQDICDGSYEVLDR